MWWWAGLAYGQDLVVDGTTLTLSGVVVYDTVSVINGGVIAVEPYDGSAGSGTLTLEADRIFIDKDSRVDGRGSGYPGVVNAAGQGPAGGLSAAFSGGGGGHGGSGTSGQTGTCLTASGAGGGALGALDGLSEPGSAGGAPLGSAITGGAGGGAVVLSARIVDIRGRIDVDGLDGVVSAGGEGSGGGAGGAVSIVADALYCEGLVSARGGSGGIGTSGLGGAGGGGRVEQWSDLAHEPCAVLVTAGRSGCGLLGNIGASDEVVDSDYDGDTYAASDGDCDTDDPSVNPSATEICDAADNNCDGIVDEASTCAGCALRAPGDHVYQYCAGPLSWEDARLDCLSRGYHLADLSNAGDNTSLGSNGDSAGVSEFWIGYNDISTEGLFVWESGSAATYTSWSPSEPGAEDCAFFRTNNRWEARDCTAPRAYACETCDNQLHYLDLDGDGYGDRKTEVYTCEPAADELLDGTDCDDDDSNHNPGETADACNGYDDDCDGIVDESCVCAAETFDGHDYLLCSSTATFDDARAYCERQGMSLATIDDSDENTWLDDTVDAISLQPWYIGLYDREGDGSFDWLFGGTSFTAYHTGEPDGLPAGAACTLINATGAAAETWRDDLCTTARRWVCEEMAGCVPSLFYRDADGDLFGDPEDVRSSCKLPAGYVADDTDCDDTSSATYPGAPEITADGVDSDCDGGEICYLDDDEDGYGVPTTATSADPDCADPGESTRTDDCDDSEEETFQARPSPAETASTATATAKAGRTSTRTTTACPGRSRPPSAGSTATTTRTPTASSTPPSTSRTRQTTATPTAMASPTSPTTTTTTISSPPSPRARRTARRATAAPTPTTAHPTTSISTPTATACPTSTRAPSMATATASRTSSTARTTARPTSISTASSCVTSSSSASIRRAPTPTLTARPTASSSAP